MPFLSFKGTLLQLSQTKLIIYHLENSTHALGVVILVVLLWPIICVRNISRGEDCPPCGLSKRLSFLPFFTQSKQGSKKPHKTPNGQADECNVCSNTAHPVYQSKASQPLVGVHMRLDKREQKSNGHCERLDNIIFKITSV